LKPGKGFNSTKGMVKNLGLKSYFCISLEEDNDSDDAVIIFYENYRTLSNKDKKFIKLICSAIKIEENRRKSSALIQENKKRLKDLLVEKEDMHQQIVQSAKLASIGELAAGIGHEINNPLFITQGNLELLTKYLINENILTPRAKRYINLQQEGLKRIQEIVQGLRTYVRSNNDIIENFDINTTISKTLKFLELIYLKDGINIEQHLYEGDYKVAGNKNHFQQVLINLLSNAKDALQNTKDKKITIVTKYLNDEISLFISDNGSGIDAEILPYIFDSFYTTKEIGEGTGLGLGIVKNILDNIGGKIEVNSQINSGTSIHITLPISNQCFAEENNISSISNDFPFKGKALVVDDEEGIRDILNEYLSDLGIQSDICSDGNEALKLLNQREYQYLITDYKMPLINGHNLITRAKNELNYQGKIFLISGAVTSDIHTIGVDGIISKPFTSEDIRNLLLTS
ncbi:MAG: hybrid sensor histidine kinase/response regulator, partial [bacterium]